MRLQSSDEADIEKADNSASQILKPKTKSLNNEPRSDATDMKSSMSDFLPEKNQSSRQNLNKSEDFEYVNQYNADESNDTQVEVLVYDADRF